MRVSLNQARRTIPGEIPSPARDFLDRNGPRVILGATNSLALPEPIAPRADTLFGPRGVALAPGSGFIAVADTGHHRLLIWKGIPDHDETPADIVIGQPDFKSEGRNAKGTLGPASLNVPTGIAIEGDVLAVADAWNHRVLIWRGLPTRNNQPADVVLGQCDFKSGLANRGGDCARADTLNWCYGVAIADGALFVADTGNRRVLRWNSIPCSNGAPADLVLGQNTFDDRDENGGHDPDARSMRWPHAIVAIGEQLFIADAGNNRVMQWNRWPERDGVPCDHVLGQAVFSSVDHNQASYFPRSNTLNMPYGLAALGGDLIVADTANSRLLGFSVGECNPSAYADRLAGQATFNDKGDNRWSTPTRDSLCWPYGIAAADGMLAIADSGNNRVLLWEAVL
jgi:hypothetical protein